jgi:hypothetical protein
MIDDNALESYRRARDRRGETVTFRRISGDAPNTAWFAATVVALVLDHSPAGDAAGFARQGAISQTNHRLIVLEEDLRAKRFPLPLRKNDTVVVRGEECNIDQADPTRRGIAGAWEIIALGVS